MQEFRWNEDKNKYLKETRRVSFEEIVVSHFIGFKGHPSRGNQVILYFYLNDYVWLAPCVVEERYLFLKTAFPSRKHTKRYLKEGKP